MSDKTKQVDDLSPEQRELLELLLAEKRKQQGVARPQRIPRRPNADRVTLSFGQQRLWFLDQWEPGCPAYNIPQAVRVSGTLDLAALERSLNHIVERHESLRTIFAMGTDDPVQIIKPELHIALPVVDLRGIAPTEQPARVQQLAVEHAQQSFDLANGPLLRATLLWLHDTEHILLITMHHIVSDGWSNGVLLQEMAALYAAYAGGQTPNLPELPVQYPDYAVWQRQWMQGEILTKQLDYWKTKLADAPPLLELATDHPRPATLTFEGARHYFDLPAGTTEALKTLSQREGVSLFMTLLAAFKVLLYRYTEQSDLLVGSPIANRNRAEIEGLIGFFVNTLVLRTQVTGNLAFQELLQQVRDVTTEAYTYQDVPFERLVEELQLDRAMSHTPLFQVVFVLQNTPMPAVQLPGITLSPLEIDSATTQFDLMLEMYETANGLRGSFQYNTALFESTTIERMTRHFCTLLSSIVADPSQAIVDIVLLSEAERQQIVFEWNDTDRDVPGIDELCMHTLFEQQVLLQPDATAAVFGDHLLTYRELNEQANQLAHQLQQLGVGRGSLVAVCLHRSMEMIPALLGILKAGAAYVPLEPSFPGSRIAWIISSLEISCLITQEAHLPLVQQIEPDAPLLAHVICLDYAPSPAIAEQELTHTQIWTRNELAHLPTENLPAQATPDDIAYIIFTSGSTGTPKGVTITHRPVINLFDWINRTFAFTSADRSLFITSLCFDLSVYDIFGLLAAGGSIQIVSDEDLREPEQLLRLMYTTPVTFWDSAPAALQQLVPFFPSTPPPSQLRLVFLSGDWIPVSLPDAMRAAFPGAEVVSLGGGTEATVWSNFHRIRAVDPEWVSIPYGRPIQNARYYILDAHLSPSPIGVPGDLYIGGGCLALGYANEPILTAEKFIPDPFSDRSHAPGTPREGAYMYRTGDRARFWADGTMEFLGRLDHQIKIRGFRVELGEIQTVLSQHPAIRDAVVLAHSGGRVAGDRYLVAYIVPQQQPAPTIAELRGYLQERLPEYMVPSTFMLLDALPVTSNGKLDRKALPAPDRARIELEAAYVTPRNSVEDTMAGIWTEVLEIDRVGVYDNFFELGGHSLLATHVISRILNTFQVELPLRALFDNPTVAGLSARVEAVRAANQGIQVPPIQPVPHDEGLPLSLSQERLWLIDQMVPGNTAYISSGAARITGPLDDAILQECFNEVIRRHAILRTRFINVRGQPAQVVGEPQPFTFSRFDLRELPAEEREARATRIAIEQAQRSFDLGKPPLIRITLVRMDDQDHLLALATHHIVYDLMSIGVFIREIRSLYEAYAHGKPSPLPPLPVQYADFAAWQQRWLSQQIMEAQLPYWKQQLHNAAAVLELPTDRPRPPIQTFHGGRHGLELSQELTTGIKQLSHEEGVTLYMTLLSAFNVLLYRYTGQTDIVVGSPVANRSRAEVEGLIGFFVNIITLRNDLSGNPTFRQLLRRVRETALGAYTHQDLPFARLVEELQPARDLSRNPIFQVMFNFLHNYMMPVPDLMDLRMDMLRVHAETEQFDLTLDFWERPEGLRGSFDYNSDLFDRSTIERMGEHLLTLLASMIANPDQPIADMALIDDGERHKLLVDWNRAAADQPGAECIHQLFEAQVARTPQAIAVHYEDARLTYAELNARANQLAHYLQELGVGPDVRVGICVERSPEMVIGLLGILKAGGAYVPLDPLYPAERLQFMLADAQVPVLVTQDTVLGALPEHQARVVCLDSDWSTIASRSAENPQSRVTGENLAYVIYTSGSTGKPKGVTVPHQSLSSYTRTATAAYGITPADRVLQFASINFDASAEEIYPCLTTGATLVLRTDTMLSSAATFLAACQDWGLTVISLPTAYWHELALALHTEELSWPPQMRLVIIGGERALPDRVALWQQYVGSEVRLVNSYGPTEATVVATIGDVERRTERSVMPREVPIGRAIANVQVYILDRNLQPAPIGVPGEVHIGGSGLARGYLNAPELTAEKFVPNPYATAPGTRLYKTGDLARYLADGRIEFVGRIDQQVKIRGFRVELGEIEAVLNQHPDLRSAVVVAREDSPGDKRLVAYVVAAEENPPTIADLRGLLKEQLPGHMVPSAFVFLEALPLLPTGKLDRKALPAPDQSRPELDGVFVAPRTALEEVVAGIWAELLEIEQVGIHDNFFELGGHSLLATQLISQIRETFEIELSLQRIFREPTVLGMATILIEEAGDAAQLEKTAELILRVAELSDDELDSPSGEDRE